MSVTSLPALVALPMGSHPAIIPALTHDASLPYTRAATAIGTEPTANSTMRIPTFLI